VAENTVARGLLGLAQAKLSLEALEQAYIKQLLAHYSDKSEVANIAGCSLRTLYRKLKVGND
jgi:DNA-binding NtrC family response regulator